MTLEGSCRVFTRGLGFPHRTDEILRVVYCSEHNGIARIGARLADLKAGKWLGHVKCTIEGYHDPENAALYFYKLIPPRKIELPTAFDPRMWPSHRGRCDGMIYGHTQSLDTVWVREYEIFNAHLP